jgi:hypothetical protein
VDPDVEELKDAGEMPDSMKADMKRKLQEQIEKKMRQQQVEEEIEEKEDLKFVHDFPNNPFGSTYA